MEPTLTVLTVIPFQAMTVRLFNKITGIERDHPDRLAANLLADKSSGWVKASSRKRKSKTTAASESNNTGD